MQSATFVADPAAPSQPSYMVLFFDNASLELSAQTRARDAAIQFIEANSGPNRYISIVRQLWRVRRSRSRRISPPTPIA